MVQNLKRVIRGMQVGGSLTGEGAEGCVFDKPLSCSTGIAPTTIGGKSVLTKLTTEDTEIFIGKQIMALPLASNYFALPTQSCRPRIPIDDPDIDKCELLQDLEDEEGYMSFSLVSLFMPNGGESIDRWSRNPTLVANNYIRIFKHLLEGMILYQKAGFIHNDIHGGNIVVDTEGVARYIDFGMVYKIDNVTTMDSAGIHNRFKPTKVWHAPEIQVWRMLNSNKGLSVKEIIIDGLNKFIQAGNNEYNIIQKLPGSEDAVTALTRFGEATQNERKADNFGAIVRKYGKKMDMWRLGLVMLHLWRSLVTRKMLGFTHSIFAKESAILHVLQGVTNFDGNKRWDPETALKHFV